MVIPYSSFALERPKNKISVNFARNRRVDLPSIEESAFAEKGQFHNPFAFAPVDIKDIDMDLYAIDLKTPEVVEVEEKDGKIIAKLKAEINNFSGKKRGIEINIYEGKHGVLRTSSIEIPEKDKKEVFVDFLIPESGDYKIGIDLKEKDKLLFSSIYPLKIEYTPVKIDMIKPFYRNSIYSTQKIEEIVLNIKTGLKEEQIKESKGEVIIVDNQEKEIRKVLFNVEKEKIVKVDVKGLKEGEYKVIAKIKTKDKEIEKNVPLYKLPPAKGNEVYVDENLNLVLNGKPILPIVWWGGSPAEEIAKTGADGIIVGFGSGVKQQLDELLKIGQYGVVMILGGNEQKNYLVGKDSLSKEAINLITERINSIKDHPALLFYYLVDEPEVRNLSVSVIKEFYEVVKKVDPYHPCSITNDSVKGIETYIECADLFIPDPYVCPLVDGKLTRDMNYIVLFMKKIKEAGNSKKFIGITPQVFDYGKVYASKPPYTTRNNRAPTFVEERCMNYLAIVYGAKGFSYYVYGKKDLNHWGAVNFPDLRIGMPYLIKEKKSLSDVILLGKDITDEMKVEDKEIHYLMKEYKGKKYIIAVNGECKEKEVEIKVPEEIKKLKVISEKREIEVKKGKFKDKFTPYQVHIYTDDLKFLDVIDLKKVEEEIKKEGGWFNYSYKQI